TVRGVAWFPLRERPKSGYFLEIVRSYRVMIPLAERVKVVADSITLAVSAKANAMKKAGIDVVGFGAGEPDFDTPTFIKDAAKAALDKGQTKYTPTPCLPELKQAIAEKLNRDN